MKLTQNRCLFAFMHLRYIISYAFESIERSEREKKKENLEDEHPYSTRAKSKKMDQILEQFQRDMQDQMQEKMAKLQQ
ncbi:intersectin-1-like [Gossypium australe]|uniref:Intersectin-1-like n=1 Tax=Gossypium australe TaxID=47621 RepID=A0A5B6WH80_9ROSI|nr:intersectin-1-like [Gossypium australe]